MNDRHQRVESLLRELAASFILTEANTNPLITITRADVSPDYRNVTIFFTTIPENKEQDALIFLMRYGREMRSFIKKKSDLKIIPSIKFSIDGEERVRQHEDGDLDFAK